MSSPRFSIIIATYDRCDSLRRLLRGIADHFTASPISHEVVVANNARDDSIAARIDEIVAEFRALYGARFRRSREPLPGKCKAQNRAVQEAAGEIVAFFDDDVEVTPEWLSVADEFFRSKPYDVMQGPILVPPTMQNDEAFSRAQYRFRTINFVKYSPERGEIKTLTGANMAIRREVFDRIGLFNEQLGPGRSGISEDVEFAQRVIAAGGKIGYEHRAGVYHEVDWSRFTEEFFRQRHEQQGRSRLIFKRQSTLSIVPNLLRSIWGWGWYTLTGDVRKKYRNKGRYFHYRAMLVEKTKRIVGSQL